MRVGRRTFYDGVLDIPEGQRGAFAIQHVVKAPGRPVQASNFRTAIYRGQSNQALTYPHETRWHTLTEDGGVWMTDYPIEQIQHDQELAGFHGQVLVGGLGLGYAATALAMRRRVREVVVVELRQEVIDLVAEHLLTKRPERAKVRVVQADLFEYLRSGAEGLRFHCGFYDIWTSDGEGTFHETVLPLRELSKGVVGRLTCWNESVMRGQLLLGLRTRIMLLPDGPQVERLADGVPDHEPGACYINWARPFWRWVRDARPSSDEMRSAAATYVKFYGLVSPADLEWLFLP